MTQVGNVLAGLEFCIFRLIEYFFISIFDCFLWIFLMIVCDTNIIVRAARSLTSASGFILQGMLRGTIPFAVSPPLIFEYEDVLKRAEVLAGHYSIEQIDVILDAVCSKATITQPWFGFRPFLDDPDDDMVIECALAAGATTIVTYDRHFNNPAVSAFGLNVSTATEYVHNLLQRNPRG
jgi:putative PIN family toxin of toxin-antitoxin system